MRVGHQHYPRLTVEDFGRHLLESNDLDPIYVALTRLRLDPVILNRWLLAYWCCYDAGVSSYLAESVYASTFWNRMGDMAANEVPSPIEGRWRRAAERRHWRGRNALNSLTALRQRYGDRPEDMADYCAHGELPGQAILATQTSCGAVMKRAQEHVGFGPWIAFKVADMAERVMGVSVSFNEAEVFMFDSPREAAAMLWMNDHNGPFEVITKVVMGKDAEREVVRYAVERLTKAFADIKAPPGWDRPVGLQEVETVLCKFKSHMSGHYPLDHDRTEIKAHLVPWQKVSPLGKRFLEAMP